jgi:hypothetical protein
LIDTIKKAGVEVNAKKTMCMLMPHHQTAGKKHYIKIANRPAENVEQFK